MSVAEQAVATHSAETAGQHVQDEASEEIIYWSGTDPDGQEQTKQARLPRVIFLR